MPYTIKSSEKLRPAGAEYETKALLYLMNFRVDSSEVYYYVVDFFNDLTGMNRTGRKMWDIQSKGAKNSSPKALGKELVTLFKNHTSDFEFDCFVLFLGGVSTTVRTDQSKNIFDIKNITPSAYKKMKQGLLEECYDKSYIDNKNINDKELDEFLCKVQFVVDDKKPHEYVKSIIKTHTKLIPNEEILNTIFNEIRDKQASKKYASVVESITIETTHEALNHFRHLTTGEIRLLTISRIINRNLFDKGVPLSFYIILNSVPDERKKDVILESQLALSKALFNKNNADSFWSLFENIYSTIVHNPDDNVNMLYEKLNHDKVDQCYDFEVISLKYFISLIKDGIE
ncbi:MULTISPECIES: hypothetical protein [Pontibacillus]|uniref:CD-NTase associated protein 4-like DNA endonuclease domain-containing protein n=1 Tax=Pontibacillus marinus BH030004 = DSM 16465 TaxID=1385511 RepID=A0A0A5I2H6_9BACI|nr:MULTISPECIES: hypothetical protein [Pontibacillus]KGX90037.1 hypothetical protein N783_02510 [Pontibacillus marinus BH030004 = DSM 16465]QHE50898.1 hypothetical protein GS400_02065 [Pontibacillus sp. HMF3514]